jgi:transcriptional regulator with XRE-family HTH domain
MTFGQKIRAIRKAKNLSQRDLATKVRVNFSYISKIENEKLDFGDYPSEELILRLAKILDTDADDLLILAKKVPECVRKRVIQRPDVFCRLSRMDDETLDRIMRGLENDAQDLCEPRSQG